MKAARRAGVVGKTSIVSTPTQFYKSILAEDWRALPSQFNLPSNSQVLARLVLEAGCEAVLYPSVKYGGSTCLAVFSRSVTHDRSFVEIADAHAPTVTRTRIDSTSVD